MKNTFFALLSLLFLISCSSLKSTEQALNSGNYDLAISNSIQKLRKNKTKKSNQPYIKILEEAYSKATEQDNNQIRFLEKDGNLANLEQIYVLYNRLNNRQKSIKPLLPLNILAENRNADFNFFNYDNDIINSKNSLSEYLYLKAKKDLKTVQNKEEARKIYNDLAYLEQINPNYKNSKELLNEAHLKGTNIVFVSVKNNSNMLIPLNLQRELLNFETYNLNDFWTEYSTNRQQNIDYDYGIDIDFTQILISPEQLKEKQLIREKQQKDGWKYLTDNKGNFVKDSLGNKIKVDKFKTIRCNLNITSQFKSAQVIGQVNIYNYRNNQLIERFPLSTKFVFENHFATYRGNKDALRDEDFNILNARFIPFPSNEQLVYDSGEQLKQQIKKYLSNYNFN